MNWAAEREWRQYCDEARGRGVKLTLAEFEPPKIPEAENFAMLPMFKSAFASPVGSAAHPFRLPKSVSGDRLSGGDPIKGTSIDWVGWQQAFKDAGLIIQSTSDPVADVLNGFDHFAPQINEWREWKQRPRCRFPVDWNAGMNIQLPHFTVLFEGRTFFGWRMRAHLAQDNSGAALDDFRDAVQTYHALRKEPTLASGLVRIAAFTVLAARVGDGLAGHLWFESDLQALATELETIRIWDDYRFAVLSERTFSNAICEGFIVDSPRQIARTWTQLRSMPMSGEPWPTSVNYFVGLTFSKHKIRENQLRLNRYIDELAARISVDGNVIDLSRPTPSGPEVEANIFRQWHYAIFDTSGASYTLVEQIYLRAQQHVAQTRLAIALERFHLAHSHFPATLDDLVPSFLSELPPDPWNGQPMKYRRSKTDSYMLHAVGKDRQDNGGAIDPMKSEIEQSDAIWLYAPP
jgi:hypothetical protein